MKRVLSLRFADSFRPIWVATVLCCSIFSLIFMANSSSAQKAVTDSRHEQSDFAASGGEESKAGTDGPLVSRREVRVQSTSTNAGQPVIVNIRVDAFGDEAAYGFVVLYDQTILSNPVIGAGNAGSLTRACNSGTAGVVNCSVGTFPNNAPGSSDPVAVSPATPPKATPDGKTVSYFEGTFDPQSKSLSITYHKPSGALSPQSALPPSGSGASSGAAP